MPQRAAPIALAGLALLVLGAMMAPGAHGLDGASKGSSSVLAAGAVLLLFLAIFATLALNAVGRLAAVAVGAFLLVTLGSALGFYSPFDAARYLWGKLDTLVLLGGISLVTGVLWEAGFFERMAARAVERSGGNRRVVMLLLCTLTYALSLFMNNLATILVVIPLSLLIAKALAMNTRVLVVGEIIASNLGGASTMVGDFPNMLIATETGIPFQDFARYLAPICLLQLVVLLAYLAPAFPNEACGRKQRRRLLRKLRATPLDRDLALRGQAVLAVMVIGFLVCGPLEISPAWVAAGAALAALVVGGVPARRLLRRACTDDVLFFACLFVMVGSVDACGILDGAGAWVANVWRADPAWGAIAVAWGAAVLTCVLNAGPTTALLIPLLLAGLGPVARQEPIWWALSLGVCAGSSGTLTGATAGPVAASMLDKSGLQLTFQGYARTGIPVMLIFLLISSCYLALVVT